LAGAGLSKVLVFVKVGDREDANELIQYAWGKITGWYKLGHVSVTVYILNVETRKKSISSHNVSKNSTDNNLCSYTIQIGFQNTAKQLAVSLYLSFSTI